MGSAPNVKLHKHDLRLRHPPGRHWKPLRWADLGNSDLKLIAAVRVRRFDEADNCQFIDE